MNFHILPASETQSSITFTWYPGFHNGADQTIYIDYREKGTAEWHGGVTVFGGKIIDKPFYKAIGGLSPDI